MHVHDILSAIAVGLVVGVLGRLVLPGRQRIGAFVTLLIGIGAALLGAWVATLFGVADRAPAHLGPLHWGWVELAIQVGFAVIGTAIAAAITHTRVVTTDAPVKRRRSPRRRTS